MKVLLQLVLPIACVAIILSGCMSAEDKEAKETAKHQATFLNSPPPPMSKPQ